uniref:GAGE domain-containing protein n=1 Tax=Mandrillus leucophaeus TaxID=9568 RepID=A0A2K5XZH5_MANLE
MSWRGRSTYRPRPRRYVEPPEMIGPMLPEPEAESQEEVRPKTDYEREDGPDVQEMSLPNPEEVKRPE